MTDPMVEKVVYACRRSLLSRMPLHVPQTRVDEVARDVGIAACDAALEASHHAELVEALKPFASGPDGTSLAKLYAHLNREHYWKARAVLAKIDIKIA